MNTHLTPEGQTMIKTIKANATAALLGFSYGILAMGAGAGLAGGFLYLLDNYLKH